MTRPALERWLADVGRILRNKIDERPQGVRLHVRLVSERDGPVSKVVLPTSPPRGALDGTEHSTRGIRINDPIHALRTDTIQRRSDVRGARRTNDCELRGFNLLPQVDHMTEQQ